MKPRRTVTRAFPLLDIEIVRSGSDGDRRTVVAYAATFGDEYEVRDVHGHYFEGIDATAFNRALSNGAGQRSACLYNHGLTFAHTPSERFSQALGKVEDVKADGRGLLTRTKYSRTQLADETLEQIADGTITAYSFTGGIYRSAAPARHASGLHFIKRMELGLSEFGPSPLAINLGAAVVAVRSSELLTADPKDLTPQERAELIALLGDPALGSADEPGTPPGTPDEGPAIGPADPATPKDSAADTQTLALMAAQRRRRG